MPSKNVLNHGKSECKSVYEWKRITLKDFNFGILFDYDVLKNKTLNRRFFNAIGAADFAAQNCIGDKIVKAFVAFSEEKEINIADW